MTAHETISDPKTSQAYKYCTFYTGLVLTIKTEENDGKSRKLFIYNSRGSSDQQQLLKLMNKEKEAAERVVRVSSKYETSEWNRWFGFRPGVQLYEPTNLQNHSALCPET